MTTLSTESNTGNTSTQENVLVEVNNLKMHFPVTSGLLFQREVAQVKAVDDISFSIQKG